jgi:predicted transposase YbfD/YdcC
VTLSKELESFLDTFEQLDDPRIDRRKLHPLLEILLLTACGVAAGCDGWSDIELFGKQRLELLRTFRPFENGVPSDDTLRRFFQSVNPEQFQRLFTQWMQQSLESEEEGSRTIAIDGKCLRGSHDGAQRALHMVSAFASGARLVLGQCKVSDKSNEITAIPQLLQALDLRGSTITIDAMGCQTAIAEQILQGGGQFVLGLKGNQGTLHDDVRTWFESPPHGSQCEIVEQADKGHGRVEHRRVSLSSDIQWLRDRHPKWSGIQGIIQIQSTRIVDGEESKEARYYLSSLTHADAAAKAIREHWGIENQLHWVLDMSFGEDQSRIRKGNAPHNIAIIRHTVLNVINTIKQPRQSVKQYRKLIGWSDEVLREFLKVLF